MKKKKGNLLEQHAEKIVLGVSVLVSLALLWLFVIGGPNAVVVSGRKLGPGEVDRHVRTQAERLDAKLKEPAVHVEYTGNHKDMYAARLQSPLEAVPDFKLVVPGRTEMIAEDREYSLPPVPPARDASAASFRGAAHVPVDEVTQENPYERALATLGDIDLVTVQASIDVAALYRNFKQSFVMGRNLRPEWKDEELATPVFASAQLQRRRLLDNGQWSEWEVVPRPRIDQYRARLAVPEKAEELKYDISMQKAQFKPFDLQRNILQPRPYDFASADTVWLTPSFYQEYVKILDREKREALRLERERAVGTRGRDSLAFDPGAGRPAQGGRGGSDAVTGVPRTATPPVRGRTNDPTLRGRTPTEGMYYDEPGEMYGVGDPRRLRQPQQRGTVDVVADNVKVLIDERTRLAEMREPLVFWAHDDSVEPGNTYEYRIRLGVFNPVAGKNWLSAQDEQRKDQVILWSEFADAPQKVVIEPMVYFFPTELARSSERGVVVEVAKYHLGNWRKQDFEVRPGEAIGKSVDLRPQTPAGGRLDTYEEYGPMGGQAVMPEKIDFGTGAMMVDVIRSDAWTGLRMIRSELIEMLYTTDSMTMRHVPVRKNNWTGDMKTQYAMIDDAVTKPVQISMSRSAGKVDIFRQQRTPYGGGVYPDGRRPYGEDRMGDRYMDPGGRRM